MEAHVREFSKWQQCLIMSLPDRAVWLYPLSTSVDRICYDQANDQLNSCLFEAMSQIKFGTKLQVESRLTFLSLFDDRRYLGVQINQSQYFNVYSSNFVFRTTWDLPPQ